MLLHTGTNPETTPYYCGGCILRALRKHPSGLPLLDLYEMVKNRDGIGSATFVLGLDWLYLLRTVTINEEGKVTPCS